MERRRQPSRPRTLKGAHIVFSLNNSPMDCTVRNLTEEGARLEVDAAQTVPDSFLLRLDSGEERNCEIRWRKQKSVGVEFVA